MECVPLQAFDACRSSPALTHLLTSGGLPGGSAGKRVLVPGCGRGYDVVEFIVKGGVAEAVGLELAPSAAEVAATYVAEQLATPEQQAKAKVVAGDFFTVSKMTGEEGFFTLGYGARRGFLARPSAPRLPACRPTAASLAVCTLPPPRCWIADCRLYVPLRAAPVHAARLGGGVGAVPRSRRAARVPRVPN